MNNKNILQSNDFTGPIFLIGMPRSGTKLLRGLLNEHSTIAIPAFETEFFPYWVTHWESYGDLSNRELFKTFYSEVMKIPYFLYCKNEDEVIDEEVWYKNCQDYTVAGVFEALIRHDANAPINTNIIWGDKSPSYITSLELIKEHFPDAKFIHIIRDVRDYCLSINHAWKKNMIRAAQRWNDYVHNAREISCQFENDYIELRFEDLLDAPDIELKKICHFLGLEFEASMLSLSKPSENVGAASGYKSVIKSNQKKYEQAMSIKVRSKIEGIAGNTLKTLNYSMTSNVPPYRVSDKKMYFYKMLDGVNLMMTTIKRIGVNKAIRYILGAFIITRK